MNTITPPFLLVAMSDRRELSLAAVDGATADARYVVGGPRQGDPRYLPGVFGFAWPGFGGIGARPTVTTALMRVTGCSLQQLRLDGKALQLGRSDNAVRHVAGGDELRCFPNDDHIEFVRIVGSAFVKPIVETTRQRVTLDGARLVADGPSTLESTPQRRTGQRRSRASRA